MAELAQKRKARAPHRSVTTKRILEVNNLLTAIDGGDAPDFDKLAGLRATLSDKLAYLKQLNREIEGSSRMRQRWTQKSNNQRTSSRR